MRLGLPIACAIALSATQVDACIVRPVTCVPAGNVVAEIQAENGSVIVVDENLQDVGGRLRVIECNSGQALFVPKPWDDQAPYTRTRQTMIAAIFDDVPRTMRVLADEIAAETGLDTQLEAGVQYCLCDGRRQADVGVYCAPAS